MAIRPRARATLLDVEDTQTVISEVTEENEVLYDLTVATLSEAFTEPLTKDELGGILERVDAMQMAELQQSDPEMAIMLWREMRQQVEAQ